MIPVYYYKCVENLIMKLSILYTYGLNLKKTKNGDAGLCKPKTNFSKFIVLIITEFNVIQRLKVHIRTNIQRYLLADIFISGDIFHLKTFIFIYVCVLVCMSTPRAQVRLPLSVVTGIYKCSVWVLGT